MITVKTYQSKEVIGYRERKYQQFLHYFLHTTISVKDIYNILGINDTNSTGRYIRRQLRKDGYDCIKRSWEIRKGDWLCTNQ